MDLKSETELTRSTMADVRLILNKYYETNVLIPVVFNPIMKWILAVICLLTNLNHA